jgi:DNA-binding transcriptional ArsR family regulator
MNAEQIISRCTRDGVVAWSQVAKQLGRSVDSVRAQYDPGYERAYCWAPSREPIPPAAPEDLIEPDVDENDMSSPYVKPTPLKERIMRLLSVQSMCAETLAHALNCPKNSIRARLDRLYDAGLVTHDGRYPRTWSIAGQGAQSEPKAA